MTKPEILEKLKPIIYNVLNVQAEEVNEDKTFKDLRADSLDSVEVIMEIEKQFNLAIPDHEMEKFTNIRSIVDYISDNLK